MASTVSNPPTSTEIACQSCGAILLIDATVRSTTCPYCASPSIIRRPPTPNRPSPSFLVGFTINHERATQLVRTWLSKSHLFARSDFKSAVPELTHGIYLPAYLYGAVAHADYSASIGENYTETETYTTTDSQGKSVRRTRTVTKTEWRPLSGRYVCYVVDVLVTASGGVSNEALEAIEPFDLRSLRAYSDSFIAGWLAEEPSRTQAECFRFAHDETVALVERRLKGFMPGDSHRNLQFQTNLNNEVINLVLLPVWSYAVRYAEDRPPVQILVNGQTGRVGGKVPVSTTKVAFAVLAVIGVLLLLALLMSLAS
ncbi:hypothetical protein [Aporhodopirellula aestuarii]|uniref:Primosomal protein N' (Replication factor Y)-superfamily II helicase n=1 Tax=Aporhodopirellula aestuarii TaxID=2950107 RepID=A0ABT0UA08_9BACT|nr:hypothetical protein [Aporhodopirellula aestuarii]MCM2373828.1 hypothetical protein [Aporhodopirellula aestuarii]